MSKSSGIDEAGRGSVFGPLIIAGVTLNEDLLNNLVQEGLKDSKLYIGDQERDKRASMAIKIQNIAIDYQIIEISAKEIDQTLKNRPYDNLNLLEIRKISKLVLQLASPDIIIDTLSSPKYSKKHLLNNLHILNKSINVTDEVCKSDSCTFFLKNRTNFKKRIVISKKADRFFPIVSAASCVAKHIRDKRLREIEKKWDLPRSILGQGYPNKMDSKIMNFLDSYKKEIKNRKFPFIRYSWSWAPLQEIIQPTLSSLDVYLQE